MLGLPYKWPEKIVKVAPMIVEAAEKLLKKYYEMFPNMRQWMQKNNERTKDKWRSTK